MRLIKGIFLLNLKFRHAGFCMNNCPQASTAVGPMCWGTCAPGLVKCGGGCALTSKLCKDTLFDQLQSTTQFTTNVISLIALAKGYSIPHIFFVSAPIEAAIMLSLKESLGVELKSFSTNMPDSIMTGILNEVIAKASSGEPLDWSKMDPSGTAALVF